MERLSMKASDPKPVKSVLTSVLQELGLGRRIKQLNVLDLWAEIVGEQIAKVATAERIDGGRLIVRVSKAPWRNELRFLKREIIVKLNRAIGEDIVKEIIFR